MAKRDVGAQHPAVTEMYGCRYCSDLSLMPFQSNIVLNQPCFRSSGVACPHFSGTPSI